MYVLETPSAETGCALGVDRRGAATFGHAVPVLGAERARQVLGQGVAVPFAVGGAQEGPDDLEVPLGDVARLAPEIGETEVDVELEQIDT
jgi:hypothetical protein